MVHDFLEIAKQCADIVSSNEDRALFWTLVNSINSDASQELLYIKKHPETLTQKLNGHLIFDLLYEKVLNNKYHPKDKDNWELALTTAIDLLSTLPDNDIIKHNKKYIMRLQGSNNNMTKLFEHLVTEDFDMGDPEFLVYSIIARGELGKLKILSSLYVVEDYVGVLDVALRFGRSAVIKYFKSNLELDFRVYGKVLNFENYKDNPRYMYYSEHIAQDDTIRNKPIIGASKQDYMESLNMVLEDYEYDVTVHTIRKWCELIKNKEYLLDKIDAHEILPLLLSHCKDSIPLTMDFGPFNSIIFGSEWSDRECLVQNCLNLKKQLEETQARAEALESRYRHLQQKHGEIVQYIHDKTRHIGRRIRRDTQ